MLFVAGMIFSGCKHSPTVTAAPLTLNSLFDTLPAAQAGEWRYEHSETDQTRDAFIAQHPQSLEGKIIYLQRIGAFDSLEEEFFDLAGDWLHSCFQLEVKILPPLNEKSIDTIAWRGQQLRTGYIMDTLLQPELPEDAAGLMAITGIDIYPGDDWNFVFGEAGTRSRLGVTSFSRFGDSHAGPQQLALFERRLLGTVLHEYLHIFGMEHCSYYNCVLNGSNSLVEADTKTLLICPQCLDKLTYALHSNRTDYFRTTGLFFNMYGFDRESEICNKAIQLLMQ